ncbi:MAG: GNAT family N-acetyltransferase [Clostridia bacterium]|nr:GNAT family N-acetyltransferase [Clostridia bacterium]
MMQIYARARAFMAEQGNPRQWGATGWPPEDVIRRDIAEVHSYVCTLKGRVCGAFFFLSGEDPEPCYRQIEDGTWMDPSPYGVVHRLASDGSVKGIGQACLDWAYAQCGHLRIDTHPDNIPMQNLLVKCGFRHCGIIHVAQDNDPRLAFEKTAGWKG